MIYPDDYSANEVMRYRKKSARKTPAKSNHKHSFQPCVIETRGVKFSHDRGFYEGEGIAISSYCPICGKLGSRRLSILFGDYTAEERKQLNPVSRTWPTFRVEDTIRAKYVNIEDKH